MNHADLFKQALDRQRLRAYKRRMLKMGEDRDFYAFSKLLGATRVRSYQRKLRALEHDSL